MEVVSVEPPNIEPGELAAWARDRIALAAIGGAFTIPDEVIEHIASDAGRDWRRAGDLLHAWTARSVLSAP